MVEGTVVDETERLGTGEEIQGIYATRMARDRS
jgi:hypothetical protein